MMSSQHEINEVQAYICCVSFPTTIDELLDLAENDEDNLFLVEKILISEDYKDGLIWTAPRWARKNDVVLFYCAKTGNVRISQLRKQLREDDYYNNKQRMLSYAFLPRCPPFSRTA